MGNDNGRDFKKEVYDKISKSTKPNQREIKIKFPVKVYSRLKMFADENTSGCYWLAFEKLLDFYEEQKAGDLRYAMLYNEIESLKTEIDGLKMKVENPVEEDEEKPKKKKTHFGEK